MGGAGFGICIVLTIISVIVIIITRDAGFFGDWDDLLEKDCWSALFRRPVTYLALLTFIMSAEHYAAHDGHKLLFTGLLGLDKTMGKFPTVNIGTVIVGVLGLVLFISEIVHINTHSNDYPDLDTFGKGGAIFFMISLCCLNILPGTLVGAKLADIIDFNSAKQAETGSLEPGSFVPVLIGAAAILIGTFITPRRDRDISLFDHGPFAEEYYSPARVGPILNIIFLVAQLLYALFFPVLFKSVDTFGAKLPSVIIGVMFKNNFNPLNPLTWTIRMYIIIGALIAYIVMFYKEFHQNTRLLIGRLLQGVSVLYTLFMFSEFLRAHTFSWLGWIIELILGVSLAISVIMWIYGLFGEILDIIAKPFNDARLHRNDSGPKSNSGMTWPPEITDKSTMKILNFVQETASSTTAVYRPRYDGFGTVEDDVLVDITDIGLTGPYSASSNGMF